MHGKIDFNLFVVLRAVYEHGSITRAANALHITQPAVSHALSRLRENLMTHCLRAMGDKLSLRRSAKASLHRS